MAKGKSVCIKVYLKPELFAEMVAQAEKVGKRRKGLLLYTQKEHGFSDEKLANTDGLSKFVKFCYQYYKENESYRLMKAAEFAEKERQLQEEKWKLGVV